MSKNTDSIFRSWWLKTTDGRECTASEEKAAKMAFEFALANLEAEKEAVVEMCASVCRRVACDCEAARLREGMTAAWKCEDAIKTLSPSNALEEHDGKITEGFSIRLVAEHMRCLNLAIRFCGEESEIVREIRLLGPTDALADHDRRVRLEESVKQDAISRREEAIWWSQHDTAYEIDAIAKTRRLTQLQATSKEGR